MKPAPGLADELTEGSLCALEANLADGCPDGLPSARFPAQEGPVGWQLLAGPVAGKQKHPQVPTARGSWCLWQVSVGNVDPRNTKSLTQYARNPGRAFLEKL